MMLPRSISGVIIQPSPSHDVNEVIVRVMQHYTVTTFPLLASGDHVIARRCRLDSSGFVGKDIIALDLGDAINHILGGF